MKLKLSSILLLIVGSIQLIYGEEATCGQLDSAPDLEVFPLISNGKSVDIIQSPWHVGIYKNKTWFFSVFEQICGGTIVHSNIIISAALCFYSISQNELVDSSNFVIGAGKNNRKLDVDEAHSQIMRVKKIYIPDNYRSENNQNNLAIVVLDEHLKFDSYVKPICLNIAEDEPLPINDHEEGFTVGWGSTSSDEVPSASLLKAKFTTMTQLECEKKISLNYRAKITEEKICLKGENDATCCTGDSGNGFYIKKNVGDKLVYSLLGIVSDGFGDQNDCSKDFVTVLTNIHVSYHQDFIKRIFKKEKVLSNV